MADRLPIWFDTSVAGYREFSTTAGDTIPAAFVTGGGGSAYETAVITFAGGAVGMPLSVTDVGAIAAATNADQHPVIGIVVSKTGDDCTVVLSGFIDTTILQGITPANGAVVWLGTSGSVTLSTPTPAANGKLVRLGTIISASGKTKFSIETLLYT